MVHHSFKVFISPVLRPLPVVWPHYHVVMATLPSDETLESHRGPDLKPEVLAEGDDVCVVSVQQRVSFTAEGAGAGRASTHLRVRARARPRPRHHSRNRT